ncbi:hypothetical protein LZ31DRAFT_176771 [Colletotrichum somersetense]|nr:hypothetical protein LZ31DRAFT_176771 [Colletotrichum somersetense]
MCPWKRGLKRLGSWTGLIPGMRNGFASLCFLVRHGYTIVLYAVKHWIAISRSGLLVARSKTYGRGDRNGGTSVSSPFRKDAEVDEMNNVLLIACCTHLDSSARHSDTLC